MHQDGAGAAASDMRLLGRLLNYFTPYRKQIGLSFLLLVTTSALQLTGPYLIKVAIDDHILTGDLAGLNRVVTAYLAVLFATFSLQYVQTYTMQLYGKGVMQDIRVSLFSHLQQMSLSFYNRVPVGRIVTRVVNDVETLSELSTQGFVETAGDFITLAGIIAAMSLLDARLAL